MLRHDTTMIQGGFARITVDTPYGPVDRIFTGSLGGRRVAFLYGRFKGPRVPSGGIDFLQNQAVFNVLGVKTIVGTFVCGGIQPEYRMGDLFVPDDLVGLGGYRASLHRGPTFRNVDMYQPFCEDTRRALLEGAGKAGLRVVDGGTYVCFHGWPRIETRAELSFYRAMGWTIVGQTLDPEATLARQNGCCYAALAVQIDDPDNRARFLAETPAEGRSAGPSAERQSSRQAIVDGRDRMARLLAEAVPLLPADGTKTCRCGHSYHGEVDHFRWLPVEWPEDAGVAEPTNGVRPWYAVSVGETALDAARQVLIELGLGAAAAGLAFDPGHPYQRNVDAFAGIVARELRSAGRVGEIPEALDRVMAALEDGLRRGIDLKYGPDMYGEMAGREREWAFGGRWTAFLGEMMAELGVSGNDVVVDVGLNDGREIAHLPNPVWGLDPSPSATARGARRYPRIAFQVGLAERLPYPDGSAGLYLSLRTLVDKVDLNAAPREALRVLRPGGGVIVSVPTGYLEADGRPVTGQVKDGIGGPVLDRAASARNTANLRSALTAAGFRLVGERETPLEVFLMARKPDGEATGP